MSFSQLQLYCLAATEIREAQPLCSNIFADTRTLENAARLLNRVVDACRHHDAPFSMERGNHCHDRSRRAACPRPHQPHRCLSHLDPGLEHISVFSRHDGYFGTRRGGWIVRLGGSASGPACRAKCGAAFCQRLFAGEPDLDDTLQRRDSPYPNADCLSLGYEASIACSPLSVCLYLHCRYRFFLVARQQSKRLPLDLLTFLRLLFLPSLVVIGINVGIFFLLYREQLKGAFDITRLRSAEQAVKHKAYFRYTCCVLAAVAFAYVIASAIQFPLSLIALSGAVLLLRGGIRWGCTSLRERARRISWSIFGFIAGMFIVVRAVDSSREPLTKRRVFSCDLQISRPIVRPSPLRFSKMNTAVSQVLTFGIRHR